jgi:hypothetical protein
MRVAETRAINRALRKAYGIGLCSVEEFGWATKSNAPAPPEWWSPSTNEKPRPPESANLQMVSSQESILP